MKPEHIEALQWLFGEEFQVSGLKDGGFVMGGLVSWGARDCAYICHLIDEKLLEREDVRMVRTEAEDDGTRYVIRVYKEGGLTTRGICSLRKGDPLTARLEALVKLKEATDGT